MTGGKDPRRFGLIGTGAISQVVHVPILAERPDVALTAVADVDLHKAETISRRFDVPLVMETEEVLSDAELDAVVIATPNHLHEELALAALRTGKHVFVERPLALTGDGAERVVAAAVEAGRTLMVGLPHRYRPDLVALQSFVGGGELGEIYAIRTSWLTRRVPVTRPTWRQRRAEAGGGALVDLGVPALDVCFWMVGYPRVRSVRAVLAHGDFEVEDAAALIIQTQDGAALSVEVSNRLYASEDRFYARVMGSEGSGRTPPLEVYKRLGGRPLDVTPRQPRPRGGENPYMNAYRRQLDHFVRCVAGECDASLPHDQAVLMRVIEAAYRSAAEGAEVAP